MKVPYRPALAIMVLGWMGCLAWAQETGSTNTVTSGNPIVWGADKEGGEPYLFIGPKGELIGYELEIIQALEKQLGRPITFRQYDFASLVPGLHKGDLDIAMNGLEVTPERREQVLFTRPYYIYRQQLVTRAGETRFSRYEDLKKVGGLRIGTMDGTAAERLLRRYGLEIAGYPAPTEAYRELAVGRIDAVVLDLPMAVAYAKKDPRLSFAGEPFAPGEYAIAIAKTQPELHRQIDTAIGQLVENGQLKAILEKWGLWDEAQEALSREGGLGNEDSAEVWTLANYFPMLLHGTLWTVLLTVCAFALAVSLGLPLALARVYGPTPVRFFVICYIEFFRGIPVMILLYLVYFGIPEAIPFLKDSIGDFAIWDFLKMSPFFAAVIGLGLNYSAYEAEIYRSALQSVPDGQWEAGLSLGMDRVTAFRRVIFPQAFKVALPPMTGDLVALFKDTSIASAISLIELNKQYQILAKSSSKFMEIGIMTALIYLALSVPLGMLSRHLEEAWSEDDEK